MMTYLIVGAFVAFLLISGLIAAARRARNAEMDRGYEIKIADPLGNDQHLMPL